MSLEPMSTGPTISVVVCTHNRAGFLRQALDSLAGQTLARGRYEVIVVNNGSTDETAATVRACQANQPQCAVRLVDEPALGLGRARNAGWEAAIGLYVAFMDDDARADAGWLERALALFEHGRPTPIAVGGQIRPWYVSGKAPWYKDEYEVRSWGPEPRRLSAGESFSGSNMIFAKPILQQLGGFDAGMGMRGTRIGMGEETVLFNEIWRRLGDQAVLLYAPDLVVYHAVTAAKMRVRYHLSRWFVAGQIASRLDPPLSFHDRLSRLRAGITAIRGLVRSAFDQRRLFPDYRPWMVERWGPVALETGRFLAGMGLHMPLHRPAVTDQHQNGRGRQWSFR